MKTIGLIGRGFVGSAVLEGMIHAFGVGWYDPFKEKWACQEKEFRVTSLLDLLRCTDGPIFVCVPTPMKADGSCSLAVLDQVLTELNGAAIQCFAEQGNGEPNNRTVIIKSTVPPGTTSYFNNKLLHITCVFNPEFLREVSAAEDFKNQDRIIIGGPHEAVSVVKQMYQAAYPGVQTTKTSSEIAEMVKYVTNCFLAVKVSFANEIAEICNKMSIDYDKVVEYATKDKRLGTSHWSVPGPDGQVGFSGSCFPKDLNALTFLANQLECHPNVLKAAWETNLRVRPGKDWEQLKKRAVE